VSLSTPTRPAAAALIAILIALGLFLRLHALDYLLPQRMNRDGLVIVHQADIIRTHAPHPDVDDMWWTLYPQLIARAVSCLPDDTATRARAATLDEHLAAASAPWVRVRLVSVLFSILCVPLTYLLARKFQPRIPSLLAAALIATSLYHTHVSTQEKPHGTVATFILLGVLAALRLKRKGDITSYLLCGISAGLAIAALHDGAAVMLAIAAACALRDTTARRSSIAWLAATLALIALAVRVAYPFLFEAHSHAVATALQADGSSVAVAGQHVSFSAFDGSGLTRVFVMFESCDPLLSVLALIGIAAWLASAFRSRDARREASRGDLAVVLAFVVPFFIVLALYADTQGRFATPLLPFAACAASYGVTRALAWLRATKLEPAIAAAVAAIAALPALRLCAIRGELDTYELAAREIERTVDPKQRLVILPYMDVPLFHAADALAEESAVPWRTIWVEYQAHLGSQPRIGTAYEIRVMPGDRAQAREQLGNDPLSYFHDHATRYVLLEGFDNDPLLASVRDVLREKAELVTRISPFTHDDEGDEAIPPRHLEDAIERPYALRLFAARCMGPTIEIFKVPG
jgi:hypothetical protein